MEGGHEPNMEAATLELERAENQTVPENLQRELISVDDTLVLAQ